MKTVRLSIQPLLCGPASIGTVEVIRLVRLYGGLGLAEAKSLVDRCVFDGEAALIQTPSAEAARALVEALSSLPGEPKVRASVECSRPT